MTTNTQRVTASVTSVSWIPSEAIEGFMRLPIDIGMGQYDDPPPDHIDDFQAFVGEERCRFANRLSAWAEIADGRIVASGSSGGGSLAATRVGPGRAAVAVPAIGYPEIRATENVGDKSVTFVQTAGGRTGAPFPRRAGTNRRFRLKSPTAWTTLALTLNADGSSSHELRGASAFPRHFFYDDGGDLLAKSATIDFDRWVEGLHDDDTPWGDSDREVHATARESALERTLSTLIMRGGEAPSIWTLDPGDVLMRQGDEATSVALILDGMASIDVDGEVLAESGPGSVLGERATLEGGKRTATVTAVTRLKIAEVHPATMEQLDLEELSEMHRREHL